MVLCKFGLHFLHLSGFVVPKPVNAYVPEYSPTDEINTADWNDLLDQLDTTIMIY
jgi:predicted phosphohydrolase